ncbi:MAG: hypothetical protein RLZZ275_977, partial [Bacteroidota bacterium]
RFSFSFFLPLLLFYVKCLEERYNDNNSEGYRENIFHT